MEPAPFSCLGVAQFGSARDLESRGRWFESNHSDFWGVVQMVEHKTLILEVEGSNPSSPISLGRPTGRDAGLRSRMVGVRIPPKALLL